MQSPKTYRSAISYGLYIPVSVLLLVLTGIVLFTGPLIAKIVICVATFGVVMPLFLHTVYVIDGGLLKVHSGWIVKTDIEIAGIKEIKKTDSILSSPALSLSERIEIFYNKYDSIVISPENKADFIADLKAINPAIISLL